MSKWLNNKKPLHTPGKHSKFGMGEGEKDLIWKVEKPCNKLGFCPYGQLVEEFPFTDKVKGLSCKVFGHDCPVFYMAEPFSE